MEEGGEHRSLSIALKCGERVPAWWGGGPLGRGGRLISEELCFISIDRGDYVSIYNWPLREWLKKGRTPSKARSTAHPTVLGAHQVKASVS